MLSLSPAKLLVILVVALIVLGPEKLPQVARQIGAAWHDFRLWRSRVENEVRGTFPNLPPTHEVAQAVRSPLAFLDRLADEHERALDVDATEAGTPAAEAGAEELGPAPPVATGDGVEGNGSAAYNGSPGGNGSAPRPAASEGVGTAVPGGPLAAPDDPSMN
jgi:sec-independent protein translocase protein TatB